MSFEMNKIAAAILVAAILAMVSGILADRFIEPKPLQKNAYAVAVPKSEQQASAKPAPAPAGLTALAGQPVGTVRGYVYPEMADALRSQFPNASGTKYQICPTDPANGRCRVQWIEMPAPNDV